MSKWSKLFIATIAVFYLLSWLWGLGLDHDEVEHLHSAWLVAQGKLPFQHFWEHHSPMVWLVAAPLLAAVPYDWFPSLLGRLLTLLLFCGSTALACLTAKRVHGGRYDAWMTAFLCMAVAGSSQLFCFRPEVFADLLSLAGVYLLVRSWGARPAFLAGLLFGLGATFNPKQICFFGLLPLAMLVARSRPTGWLKAQLVLAAGGAVGVLPLLAYLSANGLTPVFFEQVFRVNGRLSNAEGWFNYVQFTYTGLLLWALAWWHLASRMRRAAGESRHALLTVGTGLFLACAAFFGKPGNLYAYGMQVSVLLAAILATPKLAELLGWLRRRPLALTALIAAVFALDITSAYLLGDHTPHFLPRCYTATLARMAGSGKVISKTPYHPITRDDATGIFSAWQYRWLREGYPDALPLWQGVAEEIRNGKPALVLATWNDPPGGADIPAAITLPISLARSGTISPAAGDSLLAFLAAHYRLVMLGSYPFWVRNDVPENDYETPARLVR